MHPVLFRFGNMAIYTYGLFIALGFFMGMTLAKAEARRLGRNPDRITDLCFFTLLAAIVGSRLFYVITAPDAFLRDPVEVFRIWNGGLVFYGGFLGAMAVAFVYIRHYRLPGWETADIMAPGIAFGHFLGRIGCFFAGCCYGKVTDVAWSFSFYHPDSLAPTRVPLHPTQIYSALSNLAIFAILWSVRKKKRFDGQIFWLYVLVYGLARSIIEIYRGDFRGQHILGALSVSQAIGITAAAMAVVMLIRGFIRHRNGSGGEVAIGHRKGSGGGRG